MISKKNLIKYNLIKILQFNLNCSTLLIFFTFFFIIFSFGLVYSSFLILYNPDLYKSFLGDGETHIRLIYQTYENFKLTKIHYSSVYYNNYYVFSAYILKILTFFFKFDYSIVGLSAIIVNLISIYVIFITGFLICHNLTKSKIFSISIVLLLWNVDLLNFAFRIYPDILQLALMFVAIYFATSKQKFNWLLSFVFCGLAFGVKAQGLLIFIYCISLFFFLEIYEKKSSKFIVIRNVFFYSLLFLISFFIFNHMNPLKLINTIFSVAMSKKSDADFNNYLIVFKYLSFILHDKINFFIILNFIFSLFFLTHFDKRKFIFFSISIIFLVLFYFQVSSLSFYVQGPRYLNHFFLPIIVLLSISFSNLILFFSEKKLNFLTSFCAIIFLFYSVNFFSKSFFEHLSKYKTKDQITNLPLNESYNFLNNSKEFRKNDTQICADVYVPIPSSFQKVIKKGKINSFIHHIKKGNCDYLILNTTRMRRFVNFDFLETKDLNKIKVKKKELNEMRPFIRYNYKKNKIESIQAFISYIFDVKNNYQILFSNRKVIIFKIKDN